MTSEEISTALKISSGKMYVSDTNQQAKGKSVAMISNIRDEYLVNLQKLRKKYENKIRK